MNNSIVDTDQNDYDSVIDRFDSAIKNKDFEQIDWLNRLIPALVRQVVAADVTDVADTNKASGIEQEEFVRRRLLQLKGLTDRATQLVTEERTAVRAKLSSSQKAKQYTLS